MAAILPAPAQRPLPTPSPFSFSATSTRWSSRPTIHHSNLCLRFFALLFSCTSALSMAAPSPQNKGRASSSFTEYPELMYCFIVTILAFLYSALQLSKNICDITYRGILISDMISDYTSFVLDQLAGYLLISSASVTIPAIQKMDRAAALWKAAIISITMSFATFLVIAICALLSGYKLCKRIIW